MPPKLADVLRTVKSGAEFVAKLREAVTERGLADMDRAFGRYVEIQKGYGEHAQDAVRPHTTAELLEGFGGRYERLRKALPPACYNE